MGLSFPQLSSVLLMIVVGLNQADSEPSLYWDKVLPDTPMPSAIKKLLPQVLAMNPIDSGNVVDDAINFGRKGVGVNHNKPIVGMKSNDPTTFSGYPLLFYKNGATKSNDPTTFSGFRLYPYKNDAMKSNDPTTFSGILLYRYKNDVNGKSAVSENDPTAIPAKLSHVEQLKDNPAAAIFFHRKDLRPGKQSTLQLAERDGRFAAFIPREEADAIPFSASELPSVLFRYNIPPGSNMAVEMKNTLQICEAQPMEAEERTCTTSLEAMVDFAMARLGTRDVVPMSMEGEVDYFAEFRTYTVKAVKKVAEAVVAGGKGAVSCHPQPYPYSVFGCHALTTAEVYSVDLITEDDRVATMIKLPAICHLNTSMWSPDHISFKALGVEPGKGVVCHFIPQGHVTWVAKL